MTSASLWANRFTALRMELFDQFDILYFPRTTYANRERKKSLKIYEWMSAAKKQRAKNRWRKRKNKNRMPTVCDLESSVCAVTKIPNTFRPSAHSQVEKLFLFIFCWSILHRTNFQDNSALISTENPYHFHFGRFFCVRHWRWRHRRHRRLNRLR